MSIPDVLAWELIRNNNSALVKRNGVVFSREAGNLTNENSFKYSGLANAKSVDIAATKEKNGVVLSKKSTSRSRLRKPASAQTEAVLKRDFRRVSRSIRNELSGYRPDLKSAALARAFALYRAAKGPNRRPKKSGKNPKVTADKQ